jgi:hypothetical protein
LGADSIVANSGVSVLCPDVRCVTADAPTNALGETFITLAGGDPANPGTTLRNGNRKWGHYDSSIPVYVLGFRLTGKLTTGQAQPASWDAADAYQLQVKSIDVTGGIWQEDIATGEAVAIADFNAVANRVNKTPWLATDWWRDLDSTNGVAIADFNIVTAHTGHNCGVGNPIP